MKMNTHRNEVEATDNTDHSDLETHVKLTEKDDIVITVDPRQSSCLFSLQTSMT